MTPNEFEIKYYITKISLLLVGFWIYKDKKRPSLFESLVHCKYGVREGIRTPDLLLRRLKPILFS